MSVGAQRVVSILGILVGSITSLLQLLVAFGVDLTDAQTAAITSVAGVVLLVVSAWFNPDVPVGPIVGDQPTE